MTLGEQQQLFARDLVRLLLEAFELGYEVRIGEVHRTADQQAIYVKTGRSKTMNSRHLDKCAADLFFFKNKQLIDYPVELGKLWESYCDKNSWGGFWNSFKDTPHFERKA